MHYLHHQCRYLTDQSWQLQDSYQRYRRFHLNPYQPFPLHHSGMHPHYHQPCHYQNPMFLSDHSEMHRHYHQPYHYQSLRFPLHHLGTHRHYHLFHLNRYQPFPLHHSGTHHTHHLHYRYQHCPDQH